MDWTLVRKSERERDRGNTQKGGGAGVQQAVREVPELFGSLAVFICFHLVVVVVVAFQVSHCNCDGATLMAMGFISGDNRRVCLSLLSSRVTIVCRAMWHCSPHGPTTIDKFFTFSFFVLVFLFFLVLLCFFFVGVVRSYLRAFPIFGGVQLRLPCQFTIFSSEFIVKCCLVK